MTFGTHTLFSNSAAPLTVIYRSCVLELCHLNHIRLLVKKERTSGSEQMVLTNSAFETHSASSIALPRACFYRSPRCSKSPYVKSTHPKLDLKLSQCTVWKPLRRSYNLFSVSPPATCASLPVAFGRIEKVSPDLQCVPKISFADHLRWIGGIYTLLSCQQANGDTY
ncbi:hypothetical protein GYMLUDRAFT_489163 [Collybiopsis luxurians FD-317 M1]|uniref:Uncharacterized protein n=1 Tax=Collybiopsis luxurians FD-317 M1 TaxID=944289 RepID=A0A0D0D0X4_9AGAR|nr:hypothetical protein GYMLUDRAFT_489163 [Collybiopsis luxurians FD-317 M1]